MGSLVCVVIAAVLQIVVVTTRKNDDKEDVLAFGNPDGATEIGAFKVRITKFRMRDVEAKHQQLCRRCSE